MVLKQLFGLKTKFLKAKLAVTKGIRMRLDKVDKARAMALKEQNALDKEITKARKSKLSKADMKLLMNKMKRNQERLKALRTNAATLTKGLGKASVLIARSALSGKDLTRIPRRKRPMKSKSKKKK